MFCKNCGNGLKYVFIFLLFLVFNNSLFAFEGLSKSASTADGYGFRIYQIDKAKNPDSYEYYVQLTSNNSEEYFTWCFNNLAEAMEHFNWLKDIKVVYHVPEHFLFGVKISASNEDRRNSWRQYAKSAEAIGNYINYWISKTERVLDEYGFRSDWR